ncbi:MAG: trypsin-like serine peptidase [Paracoccaceae bacterium]
MPQSLAYHRGQRQMAAPQYGLPFKLVQPVLDATNPADMIRQVLDFIQRYQGYTVGVPNTSVFPFSAICRLELTFPSGSGHGTGFYIGPNLILTCGHNLYNSIMSRGARLEYCTGLTVKVGQQAAGTSLASFAVAPADFDPHPTWVASGATNQGFDLGIIRVPYGPPDGNYFHLINHSPAEDTPIAVCGYSSSSGVDGQKQHLDIDRMRNLSADFENLEYNLQTLGGASGSPVFAYFTNTSSEYPETIPVMGVHISNVPGSATLNRGVLLTPDKIDWALGGGNSSVTAFSMGARPASFGGLPLIARPRDNLGGLPIGRSMPKDMPAPMARQQSYARPLERHWIVTDEGASGGMNVAKRTFGHPTHDLSGKTTLSVRVPNMPSGGSVRWNIPDSTHRTRVTFETRGSTGQSTNGTTVTLQSLAGGPAAVDCMVLDSSGTIVESDKFWVSSPQFVFVARHPSVDTFFNSIGLGAHTTIIYDEMETVMRQLYRNVNVRLVFPGDTLPVHLGMASDPSFPGGVQVVPSVYYSETIGDEAMLDPEETVDRGSPQPYGPGIMGRNHEPGDLAGVMAPYSLARSLVNRLFNIDEVAPIQQAAIDGTLSAADLDLAAVMFGRLMGENAAHEVGHYMANAFVPHATSGFMETGGDRDFTRRTGMVATGTTDPIVTDNGRAGINDLSADLLHTFEEFLPINPPMTQAGVNARGRVGQFSYQQAVRRGGWVNGVGFARAMTASGAFMPGGGPQPGWQTRAFDAALHEAIAAGATREQAEAFFAPLFHVH